MYIYVSIYVCVWLCSYFNFATTALLLLLSGFNHFIEERNLIELFYFMIPLGIFEISVESLIAGYVYP